MDEAIEKPHQCTFCERRFRKREHLQRHRRTHTKEKPYVCECGSSFARRDLLHRHERLAHPGAADVRTTNNRTPVLTVDRETSTTVPRPSRTSQRQPQTSAVRLTTSRVEEQPEQHLVIERDPVADSAPNHTLPIPPEYYHLGTSFPGTRADENVLSHYNSFFQVSGLWQVAEGLHGSTGSCDDARESLDAIMAVPPSLDPDCASTPPVATTSGGTLTLPAITSNSANASDGLWEEYLIKNPSFTPPSTQACHRYFTSYHKNGRIALVHPNVKPGTLHFALRTATFALGALYLFEDRNAKLLFEASKSVALELWVEGAQGASALHFNTFLQLASAFILLAEFVKVGQPLDLVEQLYIFQSSLQFCLRAGIEHDNDAPSVAAEMARRSFTFGYCVLVNHSLLLGFPIIPFADNDNHRRLRLPCPQTVWKKAGNASLEQDDINRAGDLAVPYFNAFCQQTDTAEVVIDKYPTPETMLVMTTMATQRVQLAREASQLTNSTHLACAEYEQFARVTGLFSRVVHKTQENSAITAPGYDQLEDIDNFIRIVNVRECLSRGVSSLQLFGKKDPVQLAEALQEYSVGLAASPNSILLVVDVSISMLESPANTGFAFFIRLEASRWSLETVLSIFESAIFLSHWVLQLSENECPSEVSCRLLERLQHAVAMACSSLDDTGDVPFRRGSQFLAQSILGFWGCALKALETKPFAQLLGRTLEVHSQYIHSLINLG